MSSFFRIDRALLQNQEINISKIDTVATPILDDVIAELPEPVNEPEACDLPDGAEGELEKIAAQIRRKEQELEDIQKKVLEAEEHREAILSQTEKDAEQIKANAKEEGYQAGWQQAEAELKKEKAELNKDFATAVATVSHAKETIFREVEESVLDLSMCIAKKIIKKEVEDDSGIYINIVKDLLEKVKDCSDITLKVNKKEYDEFFSSDQNQFMTLLESSGVSIKPDLAVESGECMVETEFGTLRSGIQTQLNLLENDLYGTEVG